MPPAAPPPRDREMYWPTEGATTMSPGLASECRSLECRLISARWPAKMPRVGNETAVVKPALRAGSMRRSAPDTSSAIFSQLVVAGRSSGPRAGGGAGVTGMAGEAVVGVAFAGAGVVTPRPPRPEVGGAAGGAALGWPQVLRLSIKPG